MEMKKVNFQDSQKFLSVHHMSPADAKSLYEAKFQSKAILVGRHVSLPEVSSNQSSKMPLISKAIKLAAATFAISVAAVYYFPQLQNKPLSSGTQTSSRFDSTNWYNHKTPLNASSLSNLASSNSSILEEVCPLLNNLTLGNVNLLSNKIDVDNATLNNFTVFNSTDKNNTSFFDVAYSSFNEACKTISEISLPLLASLCLTPKNILNQAIRECAYLQDQLALETIA